MDSLDNIMASERKNVSIETKIQKWILKDKLAYIELLIYRSICSGPLDFDISEFYCMYVYKNYCSGALEITCIITFMYVEGPLWFLLWFLKYYMYI